MRPEARRHLRDLQQLQDMEVYLQKVRADPAMTANDHQLEAFVRLAEKVLAHERKRLGMEAA